MTRTACQLATVISIAAFLSFPGAAQADIPPHVDFYAEYTTPGSGDAGWAVVNDPQGDPINKYEFDLPHWQDGPWGSVTELYIDNEEHLNWHKDVWFEVEYSTAVPNPLPILELYDPGAGVHPSAPVVNGLNVTWHWRIDEQPAYEVIRFENSDFFWLAMGLPNAMDQIEVGTYCIPASGSLSLLGLGGLATTRRRR